MWWYWEDLMRWLETSYVPLWVILSGVAAYFLYAFWRDMRVYRKEFPPRR